ncbi:hypothetical protein ACRQ5Q_38450 [Bradyrhizobium sp. PMVTL-01]|uniref:hypothetical protein n=1 Tax=unclassified Bradyrhizobium TaxID=2631580 RepID=UPI003F6EA7F9
MTDRTNDKSTSRTQQGRGSRDDRLKSALRENLKRRKLQARERAAIGEPSHNDNGSPNAGAAGKTGD